jgi:hypothetical protein
VISFLVLDPLHSGIVGTGQRCGKSLELLSDMSDGEASSTSQRLDVQTSKQEPVRVSVSRTSYPAAILIADGATYIFSAVLTTAIFMSRRSVGLFSTILRRLRFFLIW